MKKTLQKFTELRYGLFVHFGLYSLLGRGEWAMNRERISLRDYEKLAMKFDPKKFNADKICLLAKNAGMRYIVFTTMHHDGFRMYHTELSEFCSSKTKSGRDFVKEIVAAAKRHGLMIGLYHSLDNWFDQPDAVAALEDPRAYQQFIQSVFKRIEEFLLRFPEADILWYDGWWPFDAKGWKSKKLNQMALKINPKILVNGRNGLAGDFATPEGHMAAPKPWRPWEACITMNESWGYHSGDHRWKSREEIISLLTQAAQGNGNLLLNVGPRGDGSIPPKCEKTLLEVGGWLKKNAECIYDTDQFTFGLMDRKGHRGDWSHCGSFTSKGNNLYFIIFRSPGTEGVLAGSAQKLKRVTLLESGKVLKFIQKGDRIIFKGIKKQSKLPQVVKFEFDRPPTLYLTGGMRIPKVPHPPYDPCPSDLAH